MVGPDDVVARWGGDELVVLCRHADEHGMAARRERISAAMEQPFSTPHGVVGLGASVGSAIGHHGDSETKLVAAADRHMYGVKAARR